MRDLDVAVFRAINGASELFSPAMVFFSEGNKWWWVRVLLLSVFVLLLWKKRLRMPAILAMVSWPVANAACDVLKAGFRMQRPSVDLADAIVRVDRLTSFGTASAHSATMMAVAVAFMFYDRKVGAIWLVVAVLTGLSRIYVGLHYPSQVLLGWVVGAFIAFVAVKTWQAWLAVSSRRNQESSGPVANQ